MDLNIKVEGLDGLMARLKAFPKEMAKNGGPIRSALFQGAKIIREEAKANIQQIIDEPNKGGRDDLSTGTLKKSVIMKRHRNPRSKGATEIYSVRLKRVKNPKGTPVTRYGKVLEFGSEHVKAYSWMRRAAEEKKTAVFSTIATALRKGIERVEKKLGVLKK